MLLKKDILSIKGKAEMIVSEIAILEYLISGIIFFSFSRSSGPKIISAKNLNVIAIEKKIANLIKSFVSLPPAIQGS